MRNRLEQQTSDIVVGRGIIRIKGLYLLGRRKREGTTSNVGRWEPLGGKYETEKGDDSVLAATIREVREESGLIVVAKPGYEEGTVVIEHPLRKRGPEDPEGTFTAWAFRLIIKGRAMHEPDTYPEHDMIRLFSRREALRELPLTEAAEVILFNSELTRNSELIPA